MGSPTERMTRIVMSRTAALADGDVHPNPIDSRRGSHSNATKVFDAGFHDLISIAPPGASLSPGSKLRPDQLGKVPARKGSNGWYGFDWRRAVRPSRKQIVRWEQWGANVGMRATTFPAADLDIDDELLCLTIQKTIEKHLGKAPVRTSRGSRRLLVYRTETPFGKMSLAFHFRGQDHKIEILADGQQYVIDGKHPTGSLYGWKGRPLWNWQPDDIPAVTREQMARFLSDLKGVLEARGVICTLSVGAVSANDRPLTPKQLASCAAPGATPEARARWVREAVAAIPNDLDWAPWVGMAHSNPHSVRPRRREPRSRDLLRVLRPLR